MSSVRALWLKIVHTMGRSNARTMSRPLTWNKLRIDCNDGSTVMEYRIQNGQVEYRTVDSTAEFGVRAEVHWERLTSEALRSHVMTRSVVAYWLSHRLGIDALRRACAQSRLLPRDGFLWCPEYEQGLAGTCRALQPITDSGTSEAGSPL